MIYFLFLRLGAVFALLCAPLMLISTLPFSSAAQAQTVNCDDHPACRAAIPAGAVCRIYLDAWNGSRGFNVQRLHGMAGNASRSWPPTCYNLNQAFGLQGWRFNMRGGHKVKNIGFLHERNGVQFKLEDSDGGDFADGFVWLSRLPEFSVRGSSVFQRGCRGECILELERDSADQTIVLSGFKFERQGGDGHLRRIAIIPQPLSSAASLNQRYLVAFQDDDFAYDVRLEYSLVPADKVGPMRELSKTYKREGDATVIAERRIPVHSDLVDVTATGTGNKVLRGFELRFLNGGHFIEDIGVEPGQGYYQVWFQDHQSEDDRRKPDDPFEWRVLYSSIRF